MLRYGLVFLLLCCTACSRVDRDWKETIPVTGVVKADGIPAEGVTVNFQPVGGMDTAQPTVTQAMTDKEGKFAATTYELADGAPPGEYNVTFTWGKLNRISMTFDGDDFKGKYSDPNTSKFKASVASGAPVDMGVIELSTAKK
jgi:hypothetical protein